MISKSLVVKPLAAAVLLGLAGASQAAITVYTSEDSFNSAIFAVGVDYYMDVDFFSGDPIGASPLTRTVSPPIYTYTATTSTGIFYAAGGTGDSWLSTEVAQASITFSGFSPNISAIGGNFFGSDFFSEWHPGDVTLLATDSLGATRSETITGASPLIFLGFVSTGNISSLVLNAVQAANVGTPTVETFVWPTVDNLTLGQSLLVPPPVPEPGTYALMLAGLGLLGFVARRRKRQTA